MKKFITVICILMLAAWLPAQQFQNLSFEVASDSLPHEPANWSAGKDVTIKKFDEAATQGQSCLSISYAGEEYAFVNQSVPIELSELKLFRISAQLKSSQPENGKAIIYANIMKGKVYMKFEASEVLSVNETGEWVEKSFLLWVDEDATKIKIGARLHGVGVCLIDEFKIEELKIEDKPMSSEAEAYVTEFLGLVKEHSLYKDELSIEKLRRTIQLMTQGAQTIADVQEVLGYILKKVDKHSMFWSKERMEKWRAPKVDEKSSGEMPVIPITTGHLINDDIAYLNMPGMGSGNVEELIFFADTLQQLIRALDRPDLKGWVLDLRNNTGGNCWPMLAGIGPVLGEGICGYFALEEEYNSWSYAAGESRMGGNPQTAVSGKPYTLLKENPKVAVLTGPQTSSSGEVTAVAFRARPNTKSFGRLTSGYSTTNSNFEMSDGSMLLLAVSVYADRSKQKYGKEISPDVIVEKVDGRDDPLEKAVEWLRKTD